MKNRILFVLFFFTFTSAQAVELVTQKTLEVEHYTFFNSNSSDYSIVVNKDILIPCSFQVSYQVAKFDTYKIFIERTEVDLRDASAELKCKDPGIIIPISKRENSQYLTVIFYKRSGITSLEVIK